MRTSFGPFHLFADWILNSPWTIVRLTPCFFGCSRITTTGHQIFAICRAHSPLKVSKYIGRSLVAFLADFLYIIIFVGWSRLISILAKLVSLTHLKMIIVPIAVINLTARVINSFSSDVRFFYVLRCPNSISNDCSYFHLDLSIRWLRPPQFDFRSLPSQTMSYYDVGDQGPFILIKLIV